MALNAAPVPFGEFVLSDGRQEAGGLPALLIGLLGELGPDDLDGGKTQFTQHDPKARGINSGGGLHAASPAAEVEPSRPS